MPQIFPYLAIGITDLMISLPRFNRYFDPSYKPLFISHIPVFGRPDTILSVGITGFNLIQVWRKNRGLLSIDRAKSMISIIR